MKLCNHSKIVKNDGKLLESHYKSKHTQQQHFFVNSGTLITYLLIFEIEISLHYQTVLNFWVQVILLSQSPKLLEPYAHTTLSDLVIFKWWNLAIVMLIYVRYTFSRNIKTLWEKECWISDIRFAFCLRGRYIPLNLCFFLWHKKNYFYMSKSCTVFSNHFCVVSVKTVV